MSLQILILGGTGDAARLAAGINADPKFSVTTSLAGRTDNPKKLAGKVRIGGFGGIAGLIDHLREAKVDVLVDARLVPFLLHQAQVQRGERNRLRVRRRDRRQAKAGNGCGGGQDRS